MKTFRFMMSDEEIKLRAEDIRYITVKKKIYITPSHKFVKRNPVFPKNSGLTNTGIKNRKKIDMRQNVYFHAKIRHTVAANKRYFEYIKKEGKGVDGGEPEIFGDPDFYKDNMSEDSFRFVISPGNQNIDNKMLVESFMKKLEQITPYKLSWVAATHYDTDNTHTHVLINGIDKNGKKVLFLPKSLIKYEMRNILRSYSSIMVGLRSKQEIINDFTQDIHKNNYTELDQYLDSCIDNNVFTNKYSNSDIQTTMISRVQYLHAIGLVDYKDNKYIFDKDWKKTLNLYSKHNAYLQAFNELNIPSSKYGFHDVKKDGEISGTIIKKYKMQGNANENAVVIKTDNGYKFVPLPFYPSNGISEKVNVFLNPDKKTFIKKIR